jgi:hypothetical protein
MPAYRRRRANQASQLGNSLFGGTGWLFADLMLAIAMAFLVANTVGVHTPQHKHHKIRHHKVLPCHQPPIDRGHPVKVTMTIDPAGIIAGAGRAQAHVRQKVESNSKLAGQRADIVLMYTGNAQGSTNAVDLDKKIKSILTGKGSQKSIFRDALFLPEQELDAEDTYSQLKIYLFEPQKCATP